MQRRGNPCALLVGMQIGTDMWKTVWRFFKKLNIRPTTWPSNPTLGIYPRKMKNQFKKMTYIPTFTAVVFIIAKTSKQFKCPWTGEWVEKILFSHEKEWNLAICDTIDRSWGHCAKWNKSDRERQIPYDLTYIWNLRGRKIQNSNTGNREMVMVGVVGGWAKWGSRSTNFQL